MKSTDIYSLFEARQELFEVDMSPSNLRKLASAIPGVKVGMEFEMVVPGVEVEDEDRYPDTEEDDSADTRPDSIDEIIDFFGYEDDYRGQSNNDRTLDRLRDKLDDMYAEWLKDKFTLGYLDKWIKENVEPSEVAEFAKTLPDLFGEINPGEEAYEQFTEDQWVNESMYFVQALEDFRDVAASDGDLDEEAWLRDIDIDSMREVMNEIEFGRTLEWPRYQEVEMDYAEETIESIGEDFSEAIGKPVYTSDSYHGARRAPDAYSLEPDSSIYTDGDGAGLEFISPPMSVDEMFKDLQTVKKWAKQNRAFTNKSTGLHINVSIPDYSLEDLDFVKLAVLLGDRYVLDQFGRLSNSYAKSALEIIQDRRHNTDTVDKLLTQLKGNMGAIASKILHNGRTDKYTSINTKDQYVEFRSAGGDWLDKNFDKIEDTTLRFIVALDAACDPEKYKKEYHKALYKTLKPKEEDIGISMLAKYMAGTITRSQYANSLDQDRKDRLIAKGIQIIHQEQVDEGDWEITYDDGKKSQKIYIKNNSAVPNEARATEAAKQFKPIWFTPDRVKYVTVAPYKFSEELNELNLYGAIIGNNISTSVVAKNKEEALAYLKRINPSAFARDPNVEVILAMDEGVPKRRLLQVIEWQENKMAAGDRWLQKPKIWYIDGRRFSGDRQVRNSEYRIAAANRDEAIAILSKINPALAASDSLYIMLIDADPTPAVVQSRTNTQEMLIQQRAELDQYVNDDTVPVEVANLEIFLVRSTTKSMYVAADTAREAKEFANHIDPKNFSDIAELSFRLTDSSGSPEILAAMYRRQLEQLRNPATRDPSFAAPTATPQSTDTRNVKAPVPQRISDLKTFQVKNKDTNEYRYVAGSSEMDAMNRAREAYPEFADASLSALDTSNFT